MPYAAAAAHDFINHAPASVHELVAIADWGGAEDLLDHLPREAEDGSWVRCSCDPCRARHAMALVAGALLHEVGMKGLKGILDT